MCHFFCSGPNSDPHSGSGFTDQLNLDLDPPRVKSVLCRYSVLLVLILLVFVVLRKLHCAPCAKSAQHHGRGPPADLVSVFFFLYVPKSIEDDNRTGRLFTFLFNR